MEILMNDINIDKKSVVYNKANGDVLAIGEFKRVENYFLEYQEFIEFTLNTIPLIDNAEIANLINNISLLVLNNITKEKFSSIVDAKNLYI